MLPELDAVRLRHILESAEEAAGYISNRTREDLETDRPLVHSLVRCVEIIGEAARNVSSETRGAHTDVPWSKIVGMRNRLIHGYFDINFSILWRTVSEELPVLAERLRKMLAESEEPPMPSDDS